MPKPSALDSAQWASTVGKTAQWDAVRARQAARSFKSLETAGLTLIESFPRRDMPLLPQALSRLLAASAPVRLGMARTPAFDALAHMGPQGAQAYRPLEWEAAYTGAAAAAALLEGADETLEVRVGADARVHLPAAGLHVEFSPSAAGERARLRLRRGTIASASVRRDRGEVSSPAFLPQGLPADSSDPIIARAYSNASLLSPSTAPFLSTAGQAVESIVRTAPGTAEEFLDLIRLLVPLRAKNPQISMSSSIGHVRGAIYLTHHDDVPLQYETMIHEFCHQKLFLLAEIEELLHPGQEGEIFYSPWRRDPRHLKGILLGAHAFINVMRHLLLLERHLPLSAPERETLHYGLCRRALQCAQSMETLCRYARPTAFGAEFILRLCRDLGVVRNALVGLPAKHWRQARASCDRHRRLYAGPDGVHSGAPDAGGDGE